jgi:hypothetical protein
MYMVLKPRASPSAAWARTVLDRDEPVERHLLGLEPTEELVHRAAERLAGDVPQRHLDGGDRTVAEIGIVVEPTVGRPGEELVDPHRVFADDPGNRRLQRVAHQPDQGTSRHLPDAGDAFVGVDLDDGVGEAPHPSEPPRLGAGEGDGHDMDVDVGDFHRALLIPQTHRVGPRC